MIFFFFNIKHTRREHEPKAPSVTQDQLRVPEINTQVMWRLIHVIHNTRQHHGDAREEEHEGPVVHNTQQQHVRNNPKRKSSPEMRNKTWWPVNLIFD